jgi:hypothetical protein
MSYTRFPCVKNDLTENVHLEPGIGQSSEGAAFLNDVKDMLKMAHSFVDGLSEQTQHNLRIVHLIESISRAEGLIHFIETSSDEEKLHNFDGIVTQLSTEAYFINTRLCANMKTSELYDEAVIKMQTELSLAESRVGNVLPDHQALVAQVADTLQNTSLYHDIRDFPNYKLALRVSSILDSMEAPNASAPFGVGVAVGTGGTLLLSTVLLLALRTPTAKYIGGKVSAFASAVALKLCLFGPRVEAATNEEKMGLQSNAAVEMEGLKIN